MVTVAANRILAEVASMSTAAITAERTRNLMDPTHHEGLVWRYYGNGRLVNVSGAEQRIIDVPDYAREAIILFAREQFSRGFGMMDWQDGDRLGAIERRIWSEFSVQDRASALYTLNTIWREESSRIQDAVRQAMPSWVPGQPVPNNILSPILSGEVGFNAVV